MLIVKFDECVHGLEVRVKTVSDHYKGLQERLVYEARVLLSLVSPVQDLDILLGYLFAGQSCFLKDILELT